MVSSTGVGIGNPARDSIIMSNLALWKIFSTDGSVSSGRNDLDRLGRFICSPSTSCPSGT